MTRENGNSAVRLRQEYLNIEMSCDDDVVLVVSNYCETLLTTHPQHEIVGVGES